MGSEQEVTNSKMREAAMHGSLDKFKEWVVKYANDEKLFFDDFAKDFHRLLHLGCPAAKAASEQEVNSVDADSGRSALHKAAFWGHDSTITFLVEAKADVNLADAKG